MAAAQLGHGILSVRTDRDDVYSNVMEALARIEDSSFSSIGDILIYRTDHGERGVFPFKIGSKAWFKFADELANADSPLETIAQVHDVIWDIA